MHPTAGAARDVKQEFARRKKKRGFAMLLMLLLLIVLVAAGEANLSPVLAGIILGPAIILALGTFLYVFRTWRCPACERFLGATDTAFGPGRALKTCPKCDVPLV